MCFVSSAVFYFVSGLLLRIALPGGQARPYMGLQQKCFVFESGKYRSILP